jgi:hypothetical protein
MRPWVQTPRTAKKGGGGSKKEKEKKWLKEFKSLQNIPTAKWESQQTGGKAFVFSWLTSKGRLFFTLLHPSTVILSKEWKPAQSVGWRPSDPWPPWLLWAFSTTAALSVGVHYHWWISNGARIQKATNLGSHLCLLGNWKWRNRNNGKARGIGSWIFYHWSV